MPAGSRDCRHCGLPIPGDGEEFCCFGCRIAHRVALPAAAAAEGETARPDTLLLRLGLGIFLALNVMVSSWLSYSQELFGEGARAGGFYASLTGLFSYLALFLCTIVVAMLGLPLANDALRHLAARRVTTELLIVIGVFSAYLLSAIHTFRGAGSLYYDTAAMVLVIVTLGSYLEAGAKRRASASASELLASLPRSVRVRRGDEAADVDKDDVEPGDLVRVRPGETVPVDGRVAEGTARVDESSLTGESRPRPVGAGDRLLAGSLSVDGQLWVEAEKVGDGTVLALMERSLDEARSRRPPVQRLADRVASWFVPGVVALALAVFAWEAARGEAAAGMLRGLAVLLISCPCALGLAAPLASWHALHRAAERGILIDSPATLERAAAVDRVFFDKTGTLTRPEMSLAGTAAAPGVESARALAWAASLESASSHPIARALLEEAEKRGLRPRLPQSAFTVAGLGVEGTVDGRRLRLGRWGAPPGEEQGGGSAVFLTDERGVLARFDLAETPRPDAEPTIVRLRGLGMEIGVLSGDREAPTRRLAERLGVGAEGGLLPDAKVERLTAARASTRGVAMVGDGINDAPVLAAADVGVALGSASDLAKRSGNVRLVTDRLDRVPLVFVLARDARRRIRANLTWAFAFNSVGIALAAIGWLTPIFAAAAMVASSLIVVRISSGAGRISEAEDEASRAKAAAHIAPCSPV